MSLHPETLIRREAVTLLVNAMTVAETRVSPSRRTNFRRNELPAIAVYMKDVDSEIRDEAPRSHKRTALMVVELRLESGAELDDVDEPLDAFRLQVENVLDFNRHLFDCAENVVPSGTDQDYMSSGERTIGVALMSYLVSYNQFAQLPSDAQPFTKAQTTYDLEGATDPGNQVKDCVILEGATP